MNNTKIDWCDSSWNPVTGCLHGCSYCYARGIARRFKGGGWSVYDNTEAGDYSEGGDYEEDGTVHDSRDYEDSEKDWDGHFFKYNDDGEKSVAPYPFGFDPTFRYYRLNEPMKMKRPRTVFVGSMCDLFGDWVPDEWISSVFDACAAAPQHRYLFLTKNSKRYFELDRAGKLPKEYWYGVTTVTQSHYTSSSYNRSTAQNNFVSIEPMQTLVDVSATRAVSRREPYPPKEWVPKWVIIGAETGNRKDKVVPKREWVEEIVKQCDKAGIPVFMKRGEKLNAKAVREGKEEPRYFLQELMGDNFRQDFPWRC